MKHPDIPGLVLVQIPVGTMANFSYIVGERKSGSAAAFDPAWEVPKLQKIIDDNNLRLEYIVNTHSHHDHVEGNHKLQDWSGAKIVASASSRGKKDIGIEHDGEELVIGEDLKLRFILTPGHSPESMCIVVNDYALITGDTLFIGECGRTDIPGGDSSKLYDSLEKIKSLNRALIVYPGHDYGTRPYSSLEEQTKNNYTLATRTRAEFVKFMSEP